MRQRTYRLLLKNGQLLIICIMLTSIFGNMNSFRNEENTMREVIRIDYTRIKNDPDYFLEVLQTIDAEKDPLVLADTIKSLSFAQQNNLIDLASYNLISSAIFKRNGEIFEAQKEKRATNNKGKVLTMSPTAVSSKAGAVSIGLIIAGVAVTTAMYTLLYIASLVK